ncbi:hypothetical protein VQ643_15870 [Pseudomonas sp. F1_0610]|uniref:hypothetical protein n=1 Tax=Pseudomonas sp. F1_0610 TaxID=3114284 RepID=UPI0039C034AC
MNVLVKNIRLIIIFVMVAFVFFVIGSQYEKVKRHRQEILMFANITGEQIISVNNIIDSFDYRSKDEIVLDYNMTILEDVGCSVWLDYLEYFKIKDKKLFFSGIDVALEKIDMPNNNQCIRNLLDIKR